MSHIFHEKRSNNSNLANLVYTDVKHVSKIVKQDSQNSQTSQKDFILVTHSKSVDYRITVQVIEYKYHERLIDSRKFEQLND